MAEYYHDQITEKSWNVLQSLQRTHQFTLIGGWAVYLYTHSLKSKDIDIAITLAELGKLKEKFAIAKNERLRKYEVRQEEVDIDMYVEYYSNPGLPVEIFMRHVRNQSGFTVPDIEYLLALKQGAWRERKGSAKGEKDVIDIIALLRGGVDVIKYQQILRENAKLEYLSQLASLLKSQVELPQLGLNQHQFSRLKKEWLLKIEA